MFNIYRSINDLGRFDLFKGDGASLAREAVKALTVVTMLVVGILAMTSTLPTETAAWILLGGGALSLLNFGYVAFKAKKLSQDPQKHCMKLVWQDIAFYMALTGFFFLPSVVGGGLTLGGINSSGIILGSCTIAPFGIGMLLYLYHDKKGVGTNHV